MNRSPDSFYVGVGVQQIQELGGFFADVQISDHWPQDVFGAVGPMNQSKAEAVKQFLDAQALSRHLQGGTAEFSSQVRNLLDRTASWPGNIELSA
jgi:hypothetical protein